jgi:serine/threonine protein kinase
VLGEDEADELRETPLEPLPQWIGRFQILERLGKGGQGLVVRAIDPQKATRPLALKILLTRSRGSLLRFRREFQAVHQLDHRHVVRVYESGFYRGFPYFTMEFIEGTNLRNLIWQSWGGAGSATLARHLGQLLELTGQVVEALGYIHSRRLIHRDLKPDNIMVSGESMARLMDFGLAKDLDDRAPGTMVGTVLGTAAYMAPEQILGRKELDGRTDFYALGVTLYELLTGEWPFAGDTDWMILQRHLNEDPRPPREIAPWLDPDVERLVLRLMAREPQDRPSSPQEILAQLDPLLARGSYEPPPGLEAPRDLLVPALVGHAELGPWLERLLDRLTEGESGPQVGFITGKAGYGKSRVLDSVEEWSQRRMLPVCRANCRQEKRSPFSAFAPLIESLGEFWSKLSLEDRQQLAPVAALVPGLEPRPEEPARLDARHALHATLRLLELALGRQPMVYLIDDFHWADELSVDFLQTLARRPSALPLLILTSYRPEQMEAPLSQVLESDPGSEVYLRKELAPLDGGQLAELAASALGVRPSALSDDLLGALEQVAQGSPLVALQTLQRLLREGWLRRTNGRVVLAMGAEASSFFSATVLLPRAEAPQSSEERLEAQILDLCAVYGTGLPMELLLAIIEDEESKILNTLNKLIQRRILRAIRTDEAFEFAQRAIRDEVYERIPDARRLELHGTGPRRPSSAPTATSAPWFEALAYHYPSRGQAEAALRFLERSVKKVTPPACVSRCRPIGALKRWTCLAGSPWIRRAGFRETGS